MEDVMDSDVYERLIGACIRYVSYRPRSSREFADFIDAKLKKSHTTAPIVVHRVLERLSDLGYLDDHAFCLWWVGQRTGTKSKGAKAIRLELLRKGIAPEIISDGIATVMKESRSESELARTVLEKKRTSWSLLPKCEQRQKLAGFLLRRGFESETVWSVVDEIIGKE